LNNKLKSKKLIKITIILAVLLVPIGLVASDTGYDLGDYNSGHGGSCHGGASAYPGITGSGNIDLTMAEASVKTGAEFTVTVKVTGFTEAGDEAIDIGFKSAEEENNKFTFSSNPRTIGLISGDSADEDFTVTAPLEKGMYRIKIMALHEESGGGASDLVTLTKTLDITVGIRLPTSYISAANYLVNTAENRTIGNNVGYRWEEYNGSATYSVGWGNGVAGVGDFLIEAYNKSGNTAYLNYSIGAAQWLWSVRHTGGNGTHWSVAYDANNLPYGSSPNATGISNGTAGIGKFFLNLYRKTFPHNVTYRDWAEEIAQYLKNEDRLPGDPNEMAWREADINGYNISNKYSMGTPGIGAFFMDLEEATDNTTYGWWAKNVSRYLINAADTSGIGATWPAYNNDPTSKNITGIWEGAAGIGDFLLDIYKKYGNTTAYSYANNTFEWLNSVKKLTQGGYIWDHEIGDEKNSTSFGEGVAGISTFLSRLANITANATHMALAQGALQYLISNRTIELDNSTWWNENPYSPYQNSGKGTGMAGIGEAFLFALNYTNNATYIDMVEGIYTWFTSVELRDDLNDSLSSIWRQSTDPSEINLRYSGITLGAAGVGFFLLKRAEYLNDTLAPISGYLKTALVSGASVTLNVTNALDYESGLAGAAFYIVGPGGGQGFTNETYYTISLSTAGLYTAYAIIFDAVGNPSQRTNSTTFTITGTSTPPEDDDGGSRDLWEDPDILRIYIGIIASLGVLAVVISLTRKFLLENKQEQGLRRIKKTQK